jgi:drug/metabolite transporter (DMT)-like permease
VLAAVFLFACQDTIGKYLFATYSVPYVQAIRYIINLIVLLVIFLPGTGAAFFKTDRIWLVTARALALTLGSLTGGLALRAMPLAEMVSILYLGPLLVLFLAMPLLGEKVHWYSWVATALGFVGLLFIVRPQSNLSTMGLVYSFLCLFTAVIYPILSRLLSKTETTQTLMAYVGLVGAVFYGVQLPWTMPATFPNGFDFMLMLIIGLTSLIAHSLFTMAYARAPVSLLAPFTYTHIAWAALLGWWYFAQVPDYVTFIGIGFVAAAGIGNAVINHLTSRKTEVIFEPAES